MTLVRAPVTVSGPKHVATVVRLVAQQTAKIRTNRQCRVANSLTAGCVVLPAQGVLVPPPTPTRPATHFPRSSVIERERRHSLRVMLRTAQSLPLEGLPTLGFDPAGFPTKPPVCYRSPGNYPDRTQTDKRRRAYDHRRPTWPPPVCWARENKALRLSSQLVSRRVLVDDLYRLAISGSYRPFAQYLYEANLLRQRQSPNDLRSLRSHKVTYVTRTG